GADVQREGSMLFGVQWRIPFTPRQKQRSGLCLRDAGEQLFLRALAVDLEVVAVTLVAVDFIERTERRQMHDQDIFDHREPLLGPLASAAAIAELPDRTRGSNPCRRARVFAASWLRHVGSRTHRTIRGKKARTAIQLPPVAAHRLRAS